MEEIKLKYKIIYICNRRYCCKDDKQIKNSKSNCNDITYKKIFEINEEKEHTARLMEDLLHTSEKMTADIGTVSQKMGI